MKTNFILKIKILLAGVAICISGFAQETTEVLEIQNDQSVRLQGNSVINHLIVNAGVENSGELIIESGVVQVKHMTYRFRLKPLDWTMITLPTDIPNLNDSTATNLSKAGLNFNYGTKRYQLKRFNPQGPASGTDWWAQITTPELKGGHPYLIYVVSGSSDMFDLEFYFDNISLNPGNTNANILVDLDLTGREVLKNYNIQIKAPNLKANKLDISVYNEPENVVIPVNHAEALKDANLISTEDKRGFRITLPNAQPAKVLIADRKMKKVLKAVEYVSPAVISLEGIKHGTYNVVIEYGPAMEVKTLKVAKLGKSR